MILPTRFFTWRSPTCLMRVGFFYAFMRFYRVWPLPRMMYL